MSTADFLWIKVKKLPFASSTHSVHSRLDGIVQQTCTIRQV